MDELEAWNDMYTSKEEAKGGEREAGKEKEKEDPKNRTAKESTTANDVAMFPPNLHSNLLPPPPPLVLLKPSGSSKTTTTTKTSMTRFHFHFFFFSVIVHMCYLHTLIYIVQLAGGLDFSLVRCFYSSWHLKLL